MTEDDKKKDTTFIRHLADKTNYTFAVCAIVCKIDKNKN